MVVLFDIFGAKRYNIVRFSADEVGLYIPARMNRFGTSLAARGTREEIEQHLRDKLVVVD